jgi:hypothetical protein
LPVVFVNAEAHHHDIADKIREGIGARAIWIDAILKGSAGEVREGFAQTFGGCDAMVTVYVDNDAWARSQLLEARRLTATYPGRKIPVIDAPPKDKPPLGLHNMPNMEIIDARSGIGPDVLSRLQTCLGL